MRRGANPARYERRRPEESTLNRVMQAHLDTFLTFVDIETSGAGLPAFVTDEFDAYLAWGILAHGFLRLRCNGCEEEKLVAFSSRHRGICRLCGTRRMAEAAAHLVDCVVAKVQVRQWVFSSTIPLRSLHDVHPELIAPELHFIYHAVGTFPINQNGIRHNAVGARTAAIGKSDRLLGIESVLRIERLNSARNGRSKQNVRWG